MIYLLLSILSFSAIMIVFRYFSIYRVHTFQAIVVNYITAAGLGFMLTEGEVSARHILLSAWFPNAFATGLMFIFLFYLIAVTAQKLGVSVSAVANKMSVVIPVTAAFFLYGDKVTVLKITGILLALFGVLLSSLKNDGRKGHWHYYLLPVILFFGSGLLDTFIKYTEEKLLLGSDVTYFIPTAFSVAGTAGIIVLLIRFFMRPARFSPNVVPWGLGVGLLNYASLFFLIKTLQIDDAESSVVFPLSNVGVVLTGTIASYFIFRERLSRLNWLGVIFSAVAIILMAVSA